MIGSSLAMSTGPAAAVAVAGQTAAGQITTFAGGLGSGGPLDVAQRPSWVAVHGLLVYTSDADNHVVRVFDMVSGAQRVVAGNGTQGFSGDGGPATSAQLFPGGVAVDASGNLFVSDIANHRIRRVDAAGRITTIAGTGEGGFSGDGVAATTARLSSPNDLAFDQGGNLLLTDVGNFRVRRINLLGVITTVAGNGLRGEAGDGGPALAAERSDVDGRRGPPGEVVVNGLNRVRRIGLDGVITTIAGTGQPPRTGKVGQLGDGDGGPAILACARRRTPSGSTSSATSTSRTTNDFAGSTPQGSSRRWPAADPAFSWVTAASRRGASQSTRPTGCTWPTRATTASAGSAPTAS